MDDIVRLSPNDAHLLADRLLNAVEGGHSVRICTGNFNGDAWLKYDIGNTGWTAPIYTQL
jgi:hypothetical protein